MFRVISSLNTRQEYTKYQIAVAFKVCYFTKCWKRGIKATFFLVLCKCLDRFRRTSKVYA